MSMNVIAILLSLAMMLTGVGGEGQPAEAARNLVLRNVTFTYNGETVRLGPQAHVGVSTDGSKAVYDFGVDLNDEKLLPVQLGVSDAGITAYFGGSDAGFTATAELLEQVRPELEDYLNNSLQGVQSDNPELWQFITEEYIPAYTAVLKAATDGQLMGEIKAAGRDVFDQKVQRGEGTPTTAQVESETYDAIAYSYTLDGAQLAELADALYQCTPVLADYYAATFKVFGMLPEESGLNDIHSYVDLFEKTGLQMTMDVNEQISEESGLDIMDAVLTIDMSALAAYNAEEDVEEALEEAGEAIEEAAEEAVEEVAGEAAEEAVEDVTPEDGDDEDVVGGPEPEGDAPDVPQPIVMNIHSVEYGDEYSECQLNCNYLTDDGDGAVIAMNASGEANARSVDMDFTVMEGGEKAQRALISMFTAQDGEGASSYSVSVRHVAQDVSKQETSFYGMRNVDGTSENSFSFDMRNEDGSFGLSFDLDVTGDAIEDVANTCEAPYALSYSSQTGFEDMARDQDFVQLVERVSNSFMADVGKLTADSGIQKLMTLTREGNLPIDVADLDEQDYDYTYEMDGGDEYAYTGDGEYDEEDFGFEDEEVEDDGVLAFDQPELTWMPEGWTISSADVDTAYDWVEMSVTDADGVDVAYVVFFADPEMGATNYVVTEDGSVVQGRELNITDFGDSGLSVTAREDGVYCNMMFTSEGIDVETIGKIVSGIRF